MSPRQRLATARPSTLGAPRGALPPGTAFPCPMARQPRGHAWGLERKRLLLEHEGGAASVASSPQLSLALLNATG